MVSKPLPREMWCEEYAQLCDDFRNACLNQRYYSCVSHTATARNTFLDIITALFASGTAVSAWSLWQTGWGKIAWATMAGIASVVAVIKPFLRLGEKAKHATSLQAGFTGIYLELEDLLRDVRGKKTIDESDRARRKGIIERSRKLEVQEVGKPDSQLVKRCKSEVDRQHPATSLWTREFGGGAG